MYIQTFHVHTYTDHSLFLLPTPLFSSFAIRQVMGLGLEKSSTKFWTLGTMTLSETLARSPDLSALCQHVAEVIVAGHPEAQEAPGKDM